MHKSFDSIYDNNYYYNRFINRRRKRIAIVAFDANKYNDKLYWRYACKSYIGINGLDEIQDYICRIAKIFCRINKLIFRIHLAGGFIDADDAALLIFPDNRPYQVEIIGSESKDDPTIIGSSGNSIGHMNIITPVYFSISNITFDNTRLILEKHQSSYKKKCIINNCIFINSILVNDSIDNYDITRCAFNDSKIVIVNNHIYVSHDRAITMNGNITHCLFSSNIDNSYYFELKNVRKSLSTIDIHNNTFIYNGESATALIRIFGQHFPSINLTSNVMTNISRLISNIMTSHCICMDDSNIFLGCGTELTRHVKAQSCRIM